MSDREPATGDELLRCLEREAASGDADAKLRHAAALERGGRRAEAARILRSLIDREDARAMLARHNAWTHLTSIYSDLRTGASCFVDVEPVVRSPGIRWRASTDRLSTEQAEYPVLAASPFGVVRVAFEGFEVYDVDTGSLRWRERPGDPHPHWGEELWHEFRVHADVFTIVHCDEVWRYRISSGADLGRLTLEAGSSCRLVAGTLVTHLYRPDRLVAYAIDERRGGAPVFSVELPARHGLVCAAGHLVLLAESLDAGTVRAFDVRSGECVWSERDVLIRSFVADDAAIVTSDDREVTIRSVTGEVVGRIDEPVRLVALHPEVIVAAPETFARPPSETRFVTFERRSQPLDPTDGPPGLFEGVVMDELIPASRRHFPRRELAVGSYMHKPVAIARNVMYTITRHREDWRLAACHIRGELLWELDLREVIGGPPDHPPIPVAVAALDRMVFVLIEDGTLLALTDLPTDAPL